MANVTRPKSKSFNYPYNEASEDEDVRDGLPMPSEEFHVMHLEPRPFRPFKTSEEYLYAMKEDLAEWLHTLYGLDITVDNFMEQLETGIVLCQHANKMMQIIRERQAAGTLRHIHIPEKAVFYRTDVQPETFQARDNISNFITWCRKLEIKECLLFETDDLVLRKNERSFILCLLEVARCGARFGMLAPQLVLLEQEIDAELEITGSDGELYRNNCGINTVTWSCQQNRAALLGLHEKVVNLLNRCTCPSQFPMIKVADGKYRIGDTKVLIFVRILRNHVMVRVGGGWDTLEHYLDKHDPCRCRSGHRTSTSARLTMSSGKGGAPNMQVTYNRPSQEFQQVSQTHTVTPYLVDYNGRDKFASNMVHEDVSHLNGHYQEENNRKWQEKPKQFVGGPKSRSRSFDNTSRYPEPHHASKRYSPAVRKENSDPYSSVDYSKNSGNKFHPLSNVTNNILAFSPYVRDGSPPNCATTRPQTQKTGGIRSKIPCLGQNIARTSHKSQSSEDLYRQRNFLDADDHWMKSRSSSSSPVHGAPHRNSFDSVTLGNAIYKKPSPQRGAENGTDSFARGPGQYSFRNPRKMPNQKTRSDTGNKTWAFHQRSSQRPPIHTEWLAAPGSRIPSPKQQQLQNSQLISPKKISVTCAPSSTSPHPLQRMTSDDEVSSRAILRNMEMLIDQYRSKLEEKLNNQQLEEEIPRSEEETNSQDVAPKRRQSSPTLSGCSSMRGKMSRESPGNSKIPIPQWYK